jgi:hypothetical protein
MFLRAIAADVCRAKDENRPYLLVDLFSSAAQLEMNNRSDQKQVLILGSGGCALDLPVSDRM